MPPPAGVCSEWREVSVLTTRANCPRCGDVDRVSAHSYRSSVQCVCCTWRCDTC